jgi:tRNA1Val (adenine37-N6)-methyltransferase
MANPYFQFKQFTIFHDKCAMKVGTDGVLLGAWVDVKDAGRILDVGSGSGLIAVMMAQRCQAFIDAVEIDQDACRQAEVNVSACPWGDRIKIHHISFKSFQLQNAFRYDVVVSNPPFFKESLKPPAESRSIARHNESLTYESILFGAAHLLTHGGKLAIIIPAGMIDGITREASFYNLFPSRLVKVRSVPAKDYSRCLVEFSFEINPGCHEHILTLHDENTRTYSDEFKSLMADYYLRG